jgi:hypothetical protein
MNELVQTFGIQIAEKASFAGTFRHRAEGSAIHMRHHSEGHNQ